MSIVVRYKPTSLTAEQYDESMRRLEQVGDFPPDGFEYHMCFGSDDNLHVIEIWGSREQLQSFGERLLPLLDMGIELSGEPEIFEVHNIIKG